MLSRKQKAIYLATGGAAAATAVWLGYAKSAASTRNLLGRSSARVRRTMETMATICRRIEEIDRIGRELARVGSEQKARVETVIQDTLGQLERTAETIQNNLTQSTNEIAEMLKDIRGAVRSAITPKSSQAA